MKISGVKIPAGVTITAPAQEQEQPQAPTGPSKLAVGAWWKNNNSGAAYIYNLDGTGEQKITASDGTQGDFFGESLAVSGTKVVVGSFYDDDSGNQSGSAYVYNLDGTGEQKITASDGTQGDFFGASVAISDTHIVVGAYDSTSGKGGAYVYNLDGTGEQKITASDGAGGDNFGWSVAIQGDKIAVGAPYHGGGSAYVYNLDGTGEQKITASAGAASGDNFGMCVAISGTKVIVGAQGDDDRGSNSGSAYVYNLDGTGEQKITASDGAGNDRFGGSVAISDTKIVVAARGDNSYRGAVYVYNTDGTGELKITASDGAGSDEFGESVAILGDKIAVGAPSDDDSGESSGSVYVYNTDGTGEQKITASDGAASDKFGRSVSLN